MKYLLLAGVLSVCALINSGCVNFYRIEESSFLHKTFEEHHGLDRARQARKQVLEVLPIGSSKKEIEEFCEENFSGGRRKEHEIPEKYIPEDVRGLDYVCYRVSYNAVFLVAEGWTDAVFFLDEEKTLEDVVIEGSGVSL